VERQWPPQRVTHLETQTGSTFDLSRLDMKLKTLIKADSYSESMLSSSWMKPFPLYVGGLSRRKWSPTAGGPAGPSKVATNGPPCHKWSPIQKLLTQNEDISCQCYSQFFEHLETLSSSVLPVPTGNIAPVRLHHCS